MASERTTVPQYDFTPPPGWPDPPKGWRPPPGWQPDPTWPQPPPGWNFWTPRPPSKAFRRTMAAVGILSAVTLVVVAGVVVVRGSTSDRGVTVPEGAPVPEFATIAEATAYYDDEKSQILAFVDEHPFGYDYTFVDVYVTDLDAIVRDEAGDLFPDPAVIARAGYQLASTRDGFVDLVAAWEVEYAPKPELLANASGTVAEAALDAVSAGVSDISFDDFCGTTDEALACVSSGTVVHIPLELQFYDDERMMAEFDDHWTSIMWHEFAHVIQNKYWFQLSENAEFQRLFVEPAAPRGTDDVDYPVEHSADCMAAAVLDDYIMGYPGTCTAEKLEFARGIWDASFLDS